MPRTTCPYQLAGLAALEAAAEIAMRTLVENYRELHREAQPGDSDESVTAARIVDQCGRLLDALDAHRRNIVRASLPKLP